MPLDTPLTESNALSYFAEAQKANPSIASAKARAQQQLEMARQYVIDCAEMAEAAAEDLREIKALATAIEEMRVEIKAPVLAEGKAIDEFFKAPIQFLKDAESILKKALQKYLDHVEEQQRKAEEEAHKKAEAERARLEAEHQAKLETAKSAGDEKTVAELEASLPAYVPDVVAPAVTTPVLAGITKANNWKARVVDLPALVKAVAEGKADIALLQPNDKALNNRAKEMKDALNIPGVEAYNDVQIRASRK